MVNTFVSFLRAWIYILIAVILQTLWGIVLKILDFKRVWTLVRQGEALSLNLLIQLLPLISYFLLGLLIAIVISKAYKLLPMSIVYAAWMGLTLTLQVGVDITLYNEKMGWAQYLFIGFILIGILGMKLSNPKSIQPVEVEIDGVD